MDSQKAIPRRAERMAESFTDVSNLDVDVRINFEEGVQTTVVTRLHCTIANCLEDIDLCSNGSQSIHEAICPIHGKVGSFPNYAAFQEFMRFVANGILEAGGHAPLTNRTKYVHLDDGMFQ
jgi:hypothetical protein